MLSRNSAACVEVYTYHAEGPRYRCRSEDKWAVMSRTLILDYTFTLWPSCRSEKVLTPIAHRPHPLTRVGIPTTGVERVGPWVPAAAVRLTAVYRAMAVAIELHPLIPPPLLPPSLESSLLTAGMGHPSHPGGVD